MDERWDLDKERSYADELAIVDRITDGHGTAVDKAIREPVAALRLLGFPTSQSCEGHLERALPYPWVDVGEYPSGGELDRMSRMSSSEIAAWRESALLASDLEERIRRGEVEEQRLLDTNERYRLRLLTVLDQFYARRVGAHRYRLLMDGHCQFGTFRLQSVGAETANLMNQEGKEGALHRFRKEMPDFGEYLRTK